MIAAGAFEDEWGPRLRTLSHGLASGVVGTAVMTAHQEIARRMGDSHGKGGGDEADPWQAAPAPAKVGKRILEGVFHRKV